MRLNRSTHVSALRQPLVFLALVLSPAVVVAAPRVVVTTEARPGTLARQLVLELKARGFEATLAAAPMTASPSALFELASKEHASAVIHLDSSLGGLSVWVVDELTSKLVVRALQPEEDDGALALQAVEVLRASFLELTVAPAKKGAVVDREVTAFTAPPEPSTQLAVAATGGGQLSPGGVPLAVTAAVRLELRHTWVVAGLLGAWQLTPGSLRLDERRATQGSWAASAFAGVRWGQASGLSVDAGLSAGALSFWVDGVSAPMVTSRRQALLSVTVGAYAALRVRLASRLWARADLAVDVLLNRPQVFFEKTQVAAFGWPLARLGLGLEVAVF